MDTVEKEIQRVRNLPPPTMMERLKTFLGGKDKHSVTTLSDEREKLKEDLRTLYAEKPAALAAAQNKVELAEFNEKIQTQAKLPPLPPLPPPGNTTNTVTDTTSLGNGQSQGQGQDAPHTQVHTRDMVKVDFHPQSQGDGLGEKMDETAPKVGTGNPNSLRNQHRELDPSQQQKTKGPTVGQQHEQQHHGLS
jgi:hypothetical protein